MNERDANAVLGIIIGGSPGWSSPSEAALLIYLDEIKELPDYGIARVACLTLVRTWTENRRIPIATVRESYRMEQRRRVIDQPALDDSTTYPSAAKGRKVAAAAYVAECKRQGREPNWSMFDKIIGSVNAA